MARFALLPHAATGLGALAANPAAGETRLRLDMSVDVLANGTATAPRVGVAGALRGPADVIGIADAMIARVEPAPGLRGFEPNYMPFVEFRDADFPWRYAIEQADANDRRKPWLALIALKAAEFESINRGSGPLARIKVLSPRDSLPDLAQSWATAHVQLNLGEAAGTAAQVLREREEDSFARLLCLRKLEPNTAYFTFLVPAYETGRRVGLGQPALAPGAAANAFRAPAWQAASTDPVDLPVYGQWRFITDALEDLEVLMRRLRALRADEANEPGAPGRASAAKPGYPLYRKPGAQFTIECAMRQPDQPAAPFETDEPLMDAMVVTLGQVIAGENADEDDEDPLVAFPPHGFRFRPEDSVSKASARANHWFHRINLDLKFRLAAGLGADAVRRGQELFMHHAWLQYDEIEAANAALARAELAKHLAARLAERHFARLPDEVAVALAEPIQPYARAAGGFAVVDTLRRSGVPVSFASRALRHVAAKRPVASASIGGAKAVPMPGLPGDTMLSPRLRAERRYVPNLEIIQGSMTRTLLAFSDGLSGVAPTRALLAQNRPIAGRVAVQPFEGISITKPLVDMVRALPGAKVRATLTGLTPPEAEAIRPIWRAPSLPFPLVEWLRQADPAAILSNASALPENTLAFFVENRPFIEAFMTGANHEMNNELRWREFPTDMRGTVLARFWDKADPLAVDIPELHRWRGTLGSHYPAGDDQQPNLIVVIRGDIVRKLRTPIMEINFAAAANTFVPYGGERHEATFHGTLGADIAYWGFNVSQAAVKAAGQRCFFVIYEPMGLFRFGLDVATAATRNARRDPATLNLAFPVAAVARAWRPLPRGALLRPLAVTTAPPPPASLDDLSWGHMRISPSGYIDVGQSLAVPSPAGLPPLWDAARTSASLARSFWQKPLAAYMPLARVT
ncbi:hypothetical protein ACQW02_02105 [Humitalea sp. 24SJ18S-53]|uniref:hypothetical protein n=1 Tax=Humitalea sp. 24SJ18S-53 TaxID=3422307 RepID=UPI003D6747B7